MITSFTPLLIVARLHSSFFLFFQVWKSRDGMNGGKLEDITSLQWLVICFKITFSCAILEVKSRLLMECFYNSSKQLSHNWGYLTAMPLLWIMLFPFDCLHQLICYQFYSVELYFRCQVHFIERPSMTPSCLLFLTASNIFI